MSINRLVKIAIGALLGVVALSAIVFSLGINAIRVGGEYEQEIELAAELQADILPPPLFIVEPYAVVMEGLAQDEHRAQALKQLETLRRTYNERRARWASAELDPSLRANLDSIVRNADIFWKVVEERAIPMLRSGDRSGDAAALRVMFEAYQNQQASLAAGLAQSNRYKEDAVAAAGSALQVTTAVLVALGLALFGGVMWFGSLLRRRVVSPLGELTGAARDLSEGRDVPVPHLGRADELGQLAAAFDHFVQTSAERQAAERREAEQKKAMVDVLAGTLMRMSEGDLRKILESEFEGEYRALGENLNRAILSLRDMVQQVSTSAGSIRLAASEIADASSDLSSRTQSNAAAIEQTTAALTDVDRRVTSTRDAAQSTAESADRAKNAVEMGLDKARSAAATMEEVREAAASVDGVMEALDRIAFQTRVLAMNAAVEAGHAGEAGKGFAVVADLVSQLASRAEQEARNAREQLTATSERISQAVTSVGEVEEQFSGIVSDVATVTELIDRLSEDARAQAGAIAEISAAMRQMDVSTQQNAAMVEQTSAAAANLLGDAQDLVERADSFKWNRRERDQPITVERRGAGPDAVYQAAA